MTKNPRADSKAPAVAKKTTAKKAVTTTKPAPRKTPATPPASKAAPAKATKVAKPATSARKVATDKPKKTKLVRDSFTMPDNEYALIAQVKKACVNAGFEVKKSELLRIGVALLSTMDPKSLQTAQQALAPLKAGRPKKK